MSKGWTGNFFEDFALGQEVICPIPRQIGEGERASYIALTGDRTPAFCGSESWVHPLVTFHTVFGQTVRHISLNARANLGYAGIQWHAPVRMGDTLTTRFRVVGLKENSNGKTGNVYVFTEGFNQKDELVLSFYRWVMIKKRGSEATPWLESPHIPELPASVPVEALAAPAPTEASAQVSGAAWAFEDYQVGERIFHYDGMSVNPSDHMAFTRLFHNSAKVHFDRVATGGAPLVYGGVVISHAYAAQFNGLENRLGIAAINAGTHANPVHAGATLFTMTEVVEAHRVNEERGALRLRTYVFKDVEPSTLDSVEVMVPHPKRAGRMVHRPEVVLDLDYWEWVPTRATLGI